MNLEIKILKYKLFEFLKENNYAINHKIINKVYEKMKETIGFNFSLDSRLKNKIKSSLSSMLILRKRYKKTTKKIELYKEKLRINFFNFQIMYEANPIKMDIQSVIGGDSEITSTQSEFEQEILMDSQLTVDSNYYESLSVHFCELNIEN